MSGDNKYKPGDEVWIKARVSKVDVRPIDNTIIYQTMNCDGSQRTYSWFAEDDLHGKVAGTSGLTTFETVNANLEHLRREVAEQGQRLAALEVRDDRATKSDLATEHVRVDRHMQELMDRINGVQANLDITSRMAMAAGNVDQRVRSLEQAVQALRVVHNAVATRVATIKDLLLSFAEQAADLEEGEGDDD